MSRAAKIDGLTAQQQAFVDAYAGDARAAALAAGYSESYARTKAHLLVSADRNPAIVAAIKAREPTPDAQGRIATREERQAFWTSVMRGEVTETVITKEGGVEVVPSSTRDRLKASELLGKSFADFTDKVELSADSSFAEVLKAARERSARR